MFTPFLTLVSVTHIPNPILQTKQRERALPPARYQTIHFCKLHMSDNNKSKSKEKQVEEVIYKPNRIFHHSKVVGMRYGGEARVSIIELHENDVPTAADYMNLVEGPRPQTMKQIAAIAATGAPPLKKDVTTLVITKSSTTFQRLLSTTTNSGVQWLTTWRRHIR